MRRAFSDNSLSLAPSRLSSKHRLQPMLEEDVSRYLFVYSHAQIMQAWKPGSWPHCQTSGDSIRSCRGPCRLQNRSLRQLEDMIRATCGATSPGSLIKVVGRRLQWAVGCCAWLARCEFILGMTLKKLAWLVVIHSVTHRYRAGNLTNKTSRGVPLWYAWVRAGDITCELYCMCEEDDCN